MTDDNIFFDSDDDDFEIITMKGEDGTETDFLVVDAVKKNNINYLLVIDSYYTDSDEAEAVILKEVEDIRDDSIFEILEEGAELLEISSLFSNSDDYDIVL